MEIIKRQAAIVRGLKYFFTSKPCRRGHVSRNAKSSAVHVVSAWLVLRNAGAVRIQIMSAPSVRNTVQLNVEITDGKGLE